MTSLSMMRQEYGKNSLDEKNVPENPLELFSQWLQFAIDADVVEPNAMVLSTVNSNGCPSSRVVLLKDIDKRGFSFFTNYLSRKGLEIEVNPNVSLVFDWHVIERQVRIEGIAKKLSSSESDDYFNIRPENAKIGAWASPQSRIVANKHELENLEKAAINRFAGQQIHRPTHWGGYIVKPTYIEFWQGRPNRMHDRLAYCRTENNWQLNRLAP